VASSIRARAELDKPLWHYDLASGQWAEKSEAEVGWERGFYDYFDVTTDLEHPDVTFARYEREFPPVRDHMLQRNFKGWVKQHKPFLLGYMNMMRARSPLFTEQQTAQNRTLRGATITAVDHERNQVIRGELPYSAQPTDSDGTRTDDAGWWVSDFRHRALAIDIQVMLDQFSADTLIVSRDNYDPSYVEAVVEPEFNKPNQSLAAIKPYPPSPVPSQKQAELIEVVRNLPPIRTWFLTGPRPGGVGKTALPA
jgi:hypothetical protein